MSTCKRCGGTYTFKPNYPDGEYCSVCLIFRNANHPWQILLGQPKNNKSVEQEDKMGMYAVPRKNSYGKLVARKKKMEEDLILQHIFPLSYAADQFRKNAKNGILIRKKKRG